MSPQTHGHADRRTGGAAGAPEMLGTTASAPAPGDPPPCPAPAAFGWDLGLGSLLACPPPIPHPRLFSSLSPQLLGAGVRGQPVLLLLPPLSRCLGHFHAGLVFVFFFLEGDFRTSPPNLGAAPCGLVLVPGAAGTPACPIPGGGCGGEGAKVLPCYTWMFWGGFGHFWVHPP